MSNDPKKFRIPKEFTLFGSKYSVVMDKDLYERENCYGIADADVRLIKIQSPGTVNKRYEEDGVKKSVEVVITDEVVIETFYHELFHIILDALDEDELSENEKFINILGKAMLEVYLYSSNEEEKQL